MNFAKHNAMPLFVRILHDMGFQGKADKLMQTNLMKKRVREAGDCRIPPVTHDDMLLVRPTQRRKLRLKLYVDGMPISEFNKQTQDMYSECNSNITMQSSISVYGDSSNTTAETVEWDSDFDEDLDNFA
jgi:hypothetical protein